VNLPFHVPACHGGRYSQSPAEVVHTREVDAPARIIGALAQQFGTRHSSGSGP
jgi:hypothetical protein